MSDTSNDLTDDFLDDENGDEDLDDIFEQKTFTGQKSALQKIEMRLEMIGLEKILRDELVNK